MNYDSKNYETSDLLMKMGREYGVYVCDSRSIPLICDGLKSSQRKMLWVMKNKNEKIKTISLAGEAISMGLYLHGDQSASATISMMAAPFLNNIPYFKGIGSFGTQIDPYAWGAPRYTYVKKNPIIDKLMFVDEEIIPLKDNYDGTCKEPVHFLPLIPMLLINGISGIAVGWSTEILPHDPFDVINTVKNILKGSESNLSLEPKYLNYDIIVKKINDNSWEFYGKFERIDSSKIVVYSLPPDISLEKFKERLDQLEDEEKIQEYTDESSENIRIIIKFKRGTLKDLTDNDIYNLLKLKTRKTQRIIVVDFDGNTIKKYDDTISLIKAWCNWRLNFFESRYKYLLEVNNRDLLYNKCMLECFEKQLLKRIINKRNRDEINEEIKNIIKKYENLMEKDFFEKTITSISNIPIWKWNNQTENNIRSKIIELEEKNKEYTRILSSREEQRNIYIKELESIENFLKKSINELKPSI